MKIAVSNTVAEYAPPVTQGPGSVNNLFPWKVSWKDSAWVFGLSRLAIIALTVFSTAVFPLIGKTAPQTLAERAHSWYRFDSIAYAIVAHQGYSDQHYAAFFPLWPLLIHLVGAPLGGTLDSYYLAGIVLA